MTVEPKRALHSALEARGFFLVGVRRYSYNSGVRKPVSPIPPAPAAAHEIEYAMPATSRPRRRSYAFPVALVVSLLYFAVLVAWNVHKADEIGQLVDLARLLPVSEPYTIDFWAYVLGLPAMMLTALLLVLACALGLCRRSVRGVLIAYVMLQVTLIVIHWVAATNLVRYGQFTYTRGGGTSIFVVYGGVLRTMLMAHVIFSLPLLASPMLFVPAVRRMFPSS
jgi:hypothetical protein